MAECVRVLLRLPALVAVVVLVACGAFPGTRAPAPPEDRPGPVVPPGLERPLLRMVNDARATPRRCGTALMGPAPALATDSRLTAAARGHSDWMAETETMDHTGRNGTSFADRLLDEGYDFSAVAENIARGYADPAAVLAGWLESPGHCRNIMNPAFTHVGSGVAAAADGALYWTQVFAAPR